MQEDNTMTFLTVARQLIAMQEVMQTRPRAINLQTAPARLRRQGFLQTFVLGLAPSVIALLIVPAVVGGESLAAQTHTTQATKPVLQQKTAKATQSVRPAPEVLSFRPPASPAPIRLDNQPPSQARVSWDGRCLEIEASNSSLNEILQRVAADTGAKLEGLTQDQRVFGSYGPGPRSDVLLKLLDGSGYNVLMIGGGDDDAPLEIVLSARSPASQQTATNNQNRSNPQQVEPEPQPAYPPEPLRPQSIQDPFGNGEPPHDPLQLMQEILQRQQKIDQQPQQQQQDQRNNPQE
jgi:hypothetical protein